MKRDALRARYASLVLVAIVAAVFSATVCVLMFANFVHQVPDPLTAPEFLELKAQLLDEPDNATLQTKIRDLDLALRDEFFRRRRFTLWGVYLLLGGVVTAVVAAKTAATLRRRLPHPTPAEDEEEVQARELRLSLFGVASLVASLIVITIALKLAFPTRLVKEVTPDLDHAAVAQANGSRVDDGTTSPDQPIPPEPVGEDPDTATPAPLNEVAYPSAEQLQANWPRFRGPGGLGIAPAGSDWPTQWDAAAGEGVIWKSPVDLPGKNSPVVWEDRVLLTGADEDQREVYCFDAENGALLWRCKIEAEATEREPPEVSEDTGFAAPTVVTDGARVFAVFGNGDVAACDLEGQQLWCRVLGTPDNPYGHASSLDMTEGRLFVQFDQGTKNDELGRLYALDPSTGETVWEVTRKMPASWASPLVLEHDGHRAVVTCADPWVEAFDVADGRELWKAKALSQDVGPSPTHAHGLLYVANEFPGISAIRLGGEGDVSESHLAWFAEFGAPDTCSPLVVGDLLLLLASYGTLSCYDAQEGGEEPIWEEDFDDNFHSSPSLAGEYVYLFGASGLAWVASVSRDECNTVFENDLGEDCDTSPAFHQGRIFIRGTDHLFCLGTQ
jgi:outer membrane protein assembly factor BamB